MTASDQWRDMQRLVMDRTELSKPPNLDMSLRGYGMDSLDQYELGYFLEEQYELQFSDPEIISWVTFRDVLPSVLGNQGAAPLPPPAPTDRLALIESRWRERGCPDGDFAWLLAEVKRLRALAGASAVLDEALNSGDGVYRP